MPKLYEALAEAFLAEGVDTQFVLMGDGNMHWCTAFAKLPGVHTVHVRHEPGRFVTLPVHIAPEKVSGVTVQSEETVARDYEGSWFYALR